MGEVFQFSSPYKWRCSKLFYRLFVYCSWLLIARDNSTGFTIQWGSGSYFSGGSSTYVTLPKTFSVFYSVVAILGGNGTGYIRANPNSNSNFYLSSSYGTNSYKVFWVAVGFSQTRVNSTGFTIQWGRLNQNQTFYGFPRGFSSFMSVSFSQSGASSYNVARLALNGWPNNSGFNLEQANDGKQFPAFYIACGFS